MPRRFGQRLVFVTGKGGVGKSTVAAALAIASAKAGFRTLLVDVSGRDRLGRVFTLECELRDEVELRPGVLPKLLLASGAAVWLLQAHWSRQALRRGLGPETAVWIQRRYRLLFALVGLAMLIP